MRNSIANFTPRTPVTAWGYSFNVNEPLDFDEETRSFAKVNSLDWDKFSASSTWCIPCQGKGAFACPVCRGDGIVSTREAGTVQGDAITGAISIAQPSAGKCGACTGGGFDCRDCIRGRIRTVSSFSFQN